MVKRFSRFGFDEERSKAVSSTGTSEKTRYCYEVVCTKFFTFQVSQNGTKLLDDWIFAIFYRGDVSTGSAGTGELLFTIRSSRECVRSDYRYRYWK